jgi:ABC-type nitrate/sulfonate/bicarbonate transport system permease component
MTDIFFSYSSKDRETVRPIREALAGQGFDVFWDQAVPAGVDWDTWIRQHLTKCKCAVVFWSTNSVGSDNVRHEATIAKQQGKLIPALLENLGADAFPMGLYSIQCANLSKFVGGLSDPEWRKLQQEIEAKLMPPWVRRAIDGVEAELVAERARREAAERRDQTLQDQITKEARGQQDLKRERDRALAETSALRAQLDEARRTRAELDARAVTLSQSQNDTELLRKALQSREGELHKLMAERDQLHRHCSELDRTLRSCGEELNVLRARSSRAHPDFPAIGFTNLPQEVAQSGRARTFRRVATALALSVAAWEATAFWVGANFFVPHLHQILLAFGRAPLAANTLSTLSSVGVGYSIGALLGILLLHLIRASKWVEEVVASLNIITRWLPPPALAILSMIWFGLGLAHLAVVAALVSVAAVLQAAPIGSLYGRVKFPWLGIRSGLIAALTWCLTAEMLGSTTGLGYLMRESSSAFEIADTLVTVIWFVTLCLAADLILRMAQTLVQKQSMTRLT